MSGLTRMPLVSRVPSAAAAAVGMEVRCMASDSSGLLGKFNLFNSEKKRKERERELEAEKMQQKVSLILRDLDLTKSGIFLAI